LQSIQETFSPQGRSVTVASWKSSLLRDVPFGIYSTVFPKKSPIFLHLNFTFLHKGSAFPQKNPTQLLQAFSPFSPQGRAVTMRHGNLLYYVTCLLVCIPLCSPKEPYISAEGPYLSAQELCISAKEPHVFHKRFPQQGQAVRLA